MCLQLGRGLVIVGQRFLCLQLAPGMDIVGQRLPVLAAGVGASYSRVNTSCACSWRGGWL